MNKTVLTTSDGRLIEITVASQKWQAVCSGGGLPICGHIGTWFGKEYETEEEAKTEANDHQAECPHHNPEVVKW